ncbi:hypothetical protein CGZ80_19320 [Rhodopirellula sp. MGV]|nr:hypothetical protein CGZ80_19320 [Rhodopirellula sp. MGV]PNY35300.1 hypothetical protein C2E31_17360 [Rhodopirellula baltica]
MEEKGETDRESSRVAGAERSVIRFGQLLPTGCIVVVGTAMVNEMSASPQVACIGNVARIDQPPQHGYRSQPAKIS